MLVLLMGLLYMLCEGCESEQNSYELILPALMCGDKLMRPNMQSLWDPIGKAYRIQWAKPMKLNVHRHIHSSTDLHVGCSNKFAGLQILILTT